MRLVEQLQCGDCAAMTSNPQVIFEGWAETGTCRHRCRRARWCQKICNKNIAKIIYKTVNNPL